MSAAAPPRRIGLIGHGAIGAVLARELRARPGLAPVAILTRTPQPGTTPDPGAFFGADPQIVVECAGHAALRAHGVDCLAAGRDLVVASVGALADPALEGDLRVAAEAGGGRLVIPAGALGGLDALGAALRAGLDHVGYHGRKPPAAWAGSPAEDLLDLAAVTAAVTFFTGSARAAALAFPKNANVVAAVALAGLGFDRTEVRLTADPASPGNRHEIRATGPFGVIEVGVTARALPDNPRSSMLTPYALLRSVEGLTGSLVV